MRRFIAASAAAMMTMAVGCSAEQATESAPAPAPVTTTAPPVVTPTPTAAATANFPNHADSAQDIVDALDAAGIECEYGWEQQGYDAICGTGPARMWVFWDPLAPEKQDLLDSKERLFTSLYKSEGGGFVRGSNWMLGYDADHAEGMPS